jgi:hypothetical protein
MMMKTNALGPGCSLSERFGRGSKSMSRIRKTLLKTGNQHSDVDDTPVGAQGHAVYKIRQTKPRLVRHRWQFLSIAILRLGIKI